MKHSQHPSRDEIKQYIRDSLPDKKHMEIGEHLFSCKECMEMTRTEYKNYIVLENWSAHNVGELLWRMNILTELKDNTLSHSEDLESPVPEKLAAESSPDKKQILIKRYYSKDKKVIATVEYSAFMAEVSFETRDSDISDSTIVFAFVLLNSRKVLVCDKVDLKEKSPGIWENRWQGKFPFSPDLTLMFTY